MKKTITIKKMKLRYFKGIQSLDIDFSDTTNIFGANGTGKTTIKDAFEWVIHNKDSTGRSEFEIKTLDENNRAIPQVDHEVEILLNVDGQDIEIRKVYSEKWTKSRGAAEAKHTGHETAYFWNGVPMRQKDFQSNIASICDEYVFKIITSPEAFNELHWEKRREILLEMAGSISDIDIAGDNENYKKVVKQLELLRNKDDYKKKLNASVRKQKEELKLIPARIDEVEKGKPIPLDWNKIEADLKEKQKELSIINSQIEDSSKAYEAVLKKMNQHNLAIHNTQKDIDTIKYQEERNAQQKLSSEVDVVGQLSQKIQVKSAELKSLENKYLSNNNAIKRIEQDIEGLNNAMSSKRSEWIKINKEHYSGNENCPTCKQHLPELMITDIKNNFNNQKKARLDNITKHGKSMSDEKKAKNIELTELNQLSNKLSIKIQEIKSNISDLRKELEVSKQADISKPKVTLEELTAIALSANEDYQSLILKLTQLNSEKVEAPKVDNTSLSQKRDAVQSEIDALRNDLTKKDLIDQADNRINELKLQQKNLSQEISNVDRDLFALEEFMKLKVDEIERRVRDKFRFVSFKMFNEQMNGAVSPTCEALVNGVPISDVNTAGKINAGLDIINALSEFYGVTAPIFLDNRESVTNLIPTEAQMINLIVSPEDIGLRVGHVESKQMRIL